MHAENIIVWSCVHVFLTIEPITIIKKVKSLTGVFIFGCSGNQLSIKVNNIMRKQIIQTIRQKGSVAFDKNKCFCSLTDLIDISKH